MNFNSPNFPPNPPFLIFPDEFKSPFTSPQNFSGQGFSPYSFSSPNNRNRGGPMRYFNTSIASTNSSNSTGSPYKFHRGNRDFYNRNSRGSLDSANISLYYDPTAMENPWAELEKEWEEKQLKLENAKQNVTSSK